MAFGLTAISAPGYALGDSLRPVATGLAPGRSSVELQPSIRPDARDATTAESADFSAHKGLSVLSKIANRMLWAFSVTLMFLASGCLKKQKKKLMWWFFREMVKDELVALRPVLIAGLFIVTFIFLSLMYKYSDTRRELERKGDKKGLKRWKQGAPWIIIIGSILSILASIFYGDDTALAFMIGIAVMVPEKTSETFLGPNIKITDTDVETSTRFIEPPRDQIEAQLKNGGLAPELFNMSYEAKSSSAGILESTSLGLQNIDSRPPVISIDRSQRILTAIASQA